MKITKYLRKKKFIQDKVVGNDIDEKVICHFDISRISNRIKYIG